MFRPPLLVWRLLLADVWRLLFLSAGVLVLVTAFAAAVRPLASGDIGPSAALRFMALAVPPMLQFVLPFAAGFAATLAFHRFAADNEAIAASAGGISHRAVLAPAAITGVALAGLLARLTNYEIPHYFQAMESLVSKDAAGMIVASIERGEAVEIEDILVHADKVHRLARDPRTHADRMVLEGVVALRNNGKGDVDLDITAERAEVWLTTAQQDADEVTVVTMRLHRPVAWQSGVGLAAVIDGNLKPIVFPHATTQHPKFLSTPELGELRRDPDRMGVVDRRRRALAGTIAAAKSAEEARTALRNEGRIALLDAGDQRLVLRAAALDADGDRWRLAPPTPGGPIEVDWRLAGGALRRQLAQRAWIRFRSDSPSGETLVDLDLEGVETPDAEEGRRKELRYEKRFRIANDPAPTIQAMDSAELMRLAESMAADAPDTPLAKSLTGALSDLRSRIRRLGREITGNIHERFALSVACLIMTMTGAVMALRLREGLPLTVYLWSFFPALGAVMTIAGGESVVPSREGLGLVILWSGVAGLSVYALAMYRDLCRH